MAAGRPNENDPTVDRSRRVKLVLIHKRGIANIDTRFSGFLTRFLKKTRARAVELTAEILPHLLGVNGFVIGRFVSVLQMEIIKIQVRLERHEFLLGIQSSE